MNSYIHSLSVPSARMACLPDRAAQRGASLLVAIVALVLMTMAGMALMRSVDTGNVIAGNIAFKSGTVNAADGGIEAAVAMLNATIFPAPDANLPAGCTVGTAALAGPPIVPATLGNCQYSARLQLEDENGVPLVDWSSASIPVTTLNGNDVQFVIERLCNPDTTIPVALGGAPKQKDTKTICGIAPVPEGSSSSAAKYGKTSPSMVAVVMYRATIRVIGPRNTISTIQTILAR